MAGSLGIWGDRLLLYLGQSILLRYDNTAEGELLRDGKENKIPIFCGAAKPRHKKLGFY
jgi:hypothetical protein